MEGMACILDHELTCVYEPLHLDDPQGFVEISQRPRHEATDPSLEPISSNDSLSLLQEPAFGFQHGELMRHFVRSTSTTLAFFVDTKWSWDEEVPLQADTNLFLLHGVLAVSALHICSLQPANPGEYHVMACKHYSRATGLFQSAVRNINKDNSTAILAFSLLVAIFQLNVSRTYNTPASSEVFDPFNAVFALRGAWSLMGMLHPFLMQARVGNLLRQQRLNFIDVPLDEKHAHTLDGLAVLNRSSNSPIPTKMACGQAIGILRKWYSIVAGRPATWFHVVFWPSAVPDEYVTLLQQKSPFSINHIHTLVHWDASQYAEMVSRWMG
ncbi:uncharacterized protein Z518_08201 [Rhinocladiella mackenziei CBS 650.93]|uniref:Transcription factor domain-containing protein n=1 Tax=Rhinocladiella mackenziei CBS 650.93 TaxID=1442369 RepID=A0A0D2FJW4_9EURO|nr:uncharacterized protein Z518_08201 [Rhinocladiella mackenziei CBS 650.93]KIX02262.1 hypothetical protein Z518_08201 [Rhinocladiella mackenziei CBS 650.93]